MLPNWLRLPRVGPPPADGSKFVLVHVSSDGPRPLDVKLIGTDNANAFAVSLKHTKTSSLKTKNSKLNQDQWETVLSVILLAAPRDQEDRSVTEDVEAVAKVDDSELIITIRKKIEGITHTLGSISIPADESEEKNIDIFEWCGTAIQVKDTLSHELDTMRTKLDIKDEQIKELEDQLAEFAKLKNDNETQLLEKFSLLLNEKKLKIRDQQRLLACSNVDPAKLTEVESSRAPVISRSPGPSRRGKRKAGHDNESDDSDAGFEKMEVDEPPADESEPEQAQTPEESTADEANSEDEPAIPPPTRTLANKKEEKGSSSSTAPAAKPVVLPPKRDLPFNKKIPATASNPTPPAASSKLAPPDDGSDTESDDEL